MIYYTEYPLGTFRAENDAVAAQNPAEVVYRESDTDNGRPFIMIKDRNAQASLQERLAEIRTALATHDAHRCICFTGSGDGLCPVDDDGSCLRALVALCEKSNEDNPNVLAEVKAALARMTSGPWKPEQRNTPNVFKGWGILTADERKSIADHVREEDAEAIATLRNLVPALVERCEAALHASAPTGLKCADCTIDGEACPTCYSAWWTHRHPNVMSEPEARPGDTDVLDKMRAIIQLGPSYSDRAETVVNLHQLCALFKRCEKAEAEIAALRRENERIALDSQQCHEQNDRLVDEHTALRKQLASDVYRENRDLRAQLAARNERTLAAWTSEVAALRQQLLDIAASSTHEIEGIAGSRCLRCMKSDAEIRMGKIRCSCDPLVRVDALEKALADLRATIAAREEAAFRAGANAMYYLCERKEGYNLGESCWEVMTSEVTEALDAWRRRKAGGGA